MKNAFLLFASIMFSINIMVAQNLVLKSTSCTKLQLKQTIDENEAPSLLLLEKEIDRNIWVKISSRTSKEPVEAFSNLQEGTYRVTAVFKAQRKSYSNTIFLNCTKKQLGEGKMFSIYPTPAIDEVQIEIQQYIDGEYTYSICSTAGKILEESQLLDKVSSISLKDFKSGLYLINVFKDDQYLGTSKLIIQ